MLFVFPLPGEDHVLEVLPELVRDVFISIVDVVFHQTAELLICLVVDSTDYETFKISNSLFSVSLNGLVGNE